LLQFLKSPPDGQLPALRDLAWTLQRGREAMEERLGFVASSVGEVIGKLTSFVESDSPVTGIHRGTRTRRQEVTTDRAEGPDRLAAWVNGAEVHWGEEHETPRPRRVRLPGYVFDRKRFWFGEEHKELRLAAAAAAGVGAVRPVVSLREIAPPRPAIAEVLAGMLAEVLYMEPQDISFDETFIDLGLDSVIGVEWIKLVNRHFGVKLSATKIYDHPNVSAFARFLVGAVGATPEVAPPASLDDVLERVQSGSLTVEEAESLIDKFGLATL
jgi:acyl carrier protein